MAAPVLGSSAGPVELVKGRGGMVNDTLVVMVR